MRRIGIRSCDCCGSVIDDGSNVVELGDLRLNRAFQLVSYRDVNIPVTQQQFETLELLILRAGKLVPRAAFFISILDDDCDDKQLDVVICRLRAKFKKVDPEFDRIPTVWGRGYTWLLPDQERLAA